MANREIQFVRKKSLLVKSLPCVPIKRLFLCAGWRGSLTPNKARLQIGGFDSLNSSLSGLLQLLIAPAHLIFNNMVSVGMRVGCLVETLPVSANSPPQHFFSNASQKRVVGLSKHSHTETHLQDGCETTAELGPFLVFNDLNSVVV